MPCAIASQMEAKKPRSPGFPVGSKESDFKNNVKTNSKYLDLLITDSELKCKRCVPTGYKCKLKHDNGDIISGQPGIDGQIVDSYIFTDDKTLETGLMPRMIDSVGRVMTNISIDNVLNVKKGEDAICRPYKVDINTDEDGKSVPVWCNITDETIKDADFDIHSFKDKDSKNLAINVRKNGASGQTSTGSTTDDGFQNMKGNKLNPQNLTFDDDIPMKVYYGLLGVGGIYLLYQLSKKYGIKLNLD
tara:strand:+ start:355 stop:1092 length:738 start_codon:yes stop_codon:yes gene_type:complete